MHSQARRIQKRAAGKGVLALLRKRGRRILFRDRSLGDETTKRLGMSQNGSVGGSWGRNLGGNSSTSEGRERGARRRKIAGYLKAANDLRQSYQQSYGVGKGNISDSDIYGDEQGMPGAFPDVSIVRNGDEEMVLFPSYARRHVKKEDPSPQSQQPTSDAAGEGGGNNATLDAASWGEQWERWEDDKAIADVDVRGWIYSPHRGPMSRRNRLLIGLARRLSGIPAPPSAGQSPSSGGDGSDGERQLGYREGLGARHEEDLIRRKADSILRKGEGEADVAGRGGYSEDPGVDSDRTGAYSEGSGGETPNWSSPKGRRPEQVDHTVADSSLRLERDSRSEPGTSSTNATPSSQMTPAELSAANAQLMARLKPFMTIPLVNTPITVFFYNSQTSQSRAIMTNDAGHFSVRAALEFVPTHIRVLASEDLSATEEVRIMEPTGISMISDIDDTIKHSAIGGGAREMFRNTFVRDLGELTIKGVKEWYNKLADMGVGIHYVSNSPWQLYPLLVTYFALAGLPPGSFHLKQYSGMLQGIFEPVAERKKGTLETIMRDFPDRKFLLIGDSGEADLEVYTDVVLANPGRVVGIFIRDITTPPTQGFFDSAMGPLSGERSETGNDITSEKISGGATTHSGLKPMPVRKPVLPPRPTQPEQLRALSGPPMGKLIDFDEGDSDPLPSSDVNKPPQLTRSMTEQGTLYTGGRIPTPSPMSGKPQAPVRPSKPIGLRGNTTFGQIAVGSANTALLESHRTPPPVPPKPKLYSGGEEEPSSKPRRNVTAPANIEDPPAAHRQGYIPSIRGKVSSVYNSLPSASEYWYGTSSGSQEVPNVETRNETGHNLPSDPPTPRKSLTAYPAAAAHYATNRISGGWSGNTTTATANGPGDENSVVNKKEELWKRRWARAKGVLDNQGVVLRSWRTGEDVLEEAVKLVERVRDGSLSGGK